MEKTQEKRSGKKNSGRVAGVALKIVCFLLETVLLLLIAAYSVLFMLAKGPSPAATRLFVRSVRETSAVGFLADLFFSPEEIAQMEGAGAEEIQDGDPDVVVIPDVTQPDNSQGPKPDDWGLIDEDGDGIIVEPVRGEGFSGYMMVVLDPSRVIMATDPSEFGVRGHTVADMVKKYDAVAGINAGGFYDPNGTGNGSIPDTMVVTGGQVYYGELGSANGFVGFDSNHILHTGNFTPADVKAKDIQSGVCFGPVLISGGVPRSETALASGVNPRTGIGQRSDGAVLLLVIDGRQVTSLGATYNDMAEVFLSYGAVTACNLDGGSSSMMWFDGDYVNHCASVTGIRPVPTAFLVLKEGETDRG